MVPSWTETLLEAGVEVVGRTGFCIEPPEKVKNIPVVGGTKNINWKKVQDLHADLLLLDQEENTKAMAENSPIPYFATHIQSVSDMPNSLKRLSEKLENENLQTLSLQWEKTLADLSSQNLKMAQDFSDLPGVMEWWRKPEDSIEQVLYLIWREPWMAVSPNTFIGSVLETIGLGGYLPDFAEKYPKIELESFDPSKTLLLFSSEPYDFARCRHRVEPLGYPCALVDGAQFSWFGVRSLAFLQKVAMRNKP